MRTSLIARTGQKCLPSQNSISTQQTQVERAKKRRISLDKIHGPKKRKQEEVKNHMRNPYRKRE